MPQYSFRCRACLAYQDHILKVDERDGTTTECTECGAKDLEPLLTTFSRYIIKGDNSASQKRKRQ